MGADKYNEKIFDRISAKYWDIPEHPDEMRIASYDANNNPLIIEYYRSNKLLFKHELTYDGSGRLTVKKLIR